MGLGTLMEQRNSKDPSLSQHKFHHTDVSITVRCQMQRFCSKDFYGPPGNALETQAGPQTGETEDYTTMEVSHQPLLYGIYYTTAVGLICTV